MTHNTGDYIVFAHSETDDPFGTYAVGVVRRDSDWFVAKTLVVAHCLPEGDAIRLRGTLRLVFNTAP